MKLMTLLGKRSEIIKLSLILKVLDQHSDHILVHTGEHSDENLSDIFFRDLEIRTPDVDLREKGTIPSQQDLDRKVATLIREFSPEKVVVVSASMSSVAAAAQDSSSIYIFDAGRRASEDLGASSVLMPFASTGRDNLLRDGADPSKVFVVGDPVKEIIDTFDDRIEASGVMSALGLNPFDFFLATVHRPENLGQDALKKVIEGLGAVAAKFGKKVLFAAHPDTARNIEAFKIPAPQNVRLLRALSYFDFVKLEKNALAVLTDSTTVQEECAVLRVPNITLRTTTPRMETITCGSNMLAGIEAENMIRAVEISIAQAASWDAPAEYSRPNVSQIVSKILLAN